MTYQPTPEQSQVIDAKAPVLVVLGGAGTGKTTTAAVAASRHLHSKDAARAAARTDIVRTGRRRRLAAPDRVLFLSFSRTAVAQVTERASTVVGPALQRLDVSTFDGLAWRIINAFGARYGYPPPQTVLGTASARVPGAPQGLTYKQLIPAAHNLLAQANIAAYYSQRYSLVICDEFQDTNDLEWAFLQHIAPAARRILLGDENQCIYADMKNIDPAARIADACALPGSIRINLPLNSHRDPTQIIPAAAVAALKRDFTHPDIAHAAATGRLHATRRNSPKGYNEIVHLTLEARQRGQSVNVFTHTNDATTDLSDALTTAGVAHEQVGFGEAHGEALQAQLELLRAALGQPAEVRRALAVYITANHRSKSLPPLATQMLQATNPALERQLRTLLNNLTAAGDTKDKTALTAAIRDAYRQIGTTRGQETWTQASGQFASALALLDEQRGGLAAVEAQLSQGHDDALLRLHRNRARQVQVMNLHQTKGREADVTMLLLHDDEWHGYEREPFRKASRLLYVVLTRARLQTHIVHGSRVHALWQPLLEAVHAAQPAVER